MRITSAPDGVPPILVEGFVVASTCAELTDRGWVTVPVTHTAAQGVDITATKAGRRLLIEAKGAGSSKPGTSRYGKPFHSGQVEISIAAAIYKALSVEPPDLGAIALPDLPLFHKKLNEGIAANLRQLGIPIFWASENGSVTIDNSDALEP